MNKQKNGIRSFSIPCLLLKQDIEVLLDKQKLNKKTFDVSKEISHVDKDNTSSSVCKKQAILPYLNDTPTVVIETTKKDIKCNKPKVPFEQGIGIPPLKIRRSVQGDGSFYYQVHYSPERNKKKKLCSDDNRSTMHHLTSEVQVTSNQDKVVIDLTCDDDDDQETSIVVSDVNSLSIENAWPTSIVDCSSFPNQPLSSSSSSYCISVTMDTLTDCSPALTVVTVPAENIDTDFKRNRTRKRNRDDEILAIRSVTVDQHVTTQNRTLRNITTSAYTSTPQLRTLRNITTSAYTSTPQLRTLRNITTSAYTSTPQLRTPRNITTSAYTSTPQLRTPRNITTSEYTSTPQLRTPHNITTSAYTSTPQLRTPRNITTSAHTSTPQLRTPHNITTSAYTSTPQLRTPHNITTSLCTSTPQLRTPRNITTSAHTSTPQLRTPHNITTSAYTSTPQLRTPHNITTSLCTSTPQLRQQPNQVSNLLSTIKPPLWNGLMIPNVANVCNHTSSTSNSPENIYTLTNLLYLTSQPVVLPYITPSQPCSIYSTAKFISSHSTDNTHGLVSQVPQISNSICTPKSNPTQPIAKYCSSPRQLQCSSSKHPVAKDLLPRQPVIDPRLQRPTDPRRPVTDPRQPVADHRRPVTDPRRPVTDPRRSVTKYSLQLKAPLSKINISSDNNIKTQTAITPPKIKLEPIPIPISPTEDYDMILLNWQVQLNNQRKGRDAFVHVENKVDKAYPPMNFTYITDSIYTEGIPATDPTALVGCRCVNCGYLSSFCCPHMAGHKFAYTKTGKVKVSYGTPIYECNAMCLCKDDCINRVVQKGRKIPVCIFRTPNGRGWGVKSCSLIRKNTFVTEYVGELVTAEVADRKGEQYDKDGVTYLFDLDFVDDHSEFTIDAAQYGNISHFFNHSCDPNLKVFSVWIDTLDPRLPRLALFTKRDIQEGEELTFDYKMGHNMSAGKTGKVQCLCGSERCCGFLF